MASQAFLPSTSLRELTSIFAKTAKYAPMPEKDFFWSQFPKLPLSNSKGLLTTCEK